MNRKSLTRTPVFVALILLASGTFAQDEKLDIEIGVDKEPEWYQQPWVWVVGAAVFILLLIAILRSGRSRT